MFLSTLLRRRAAPAITRPTPMLVDMPVRPYMLQWLPKYKEIAYPRYFDNPMRRWDSGNKTKKYAYFS